MIEAAVWTVIGRIRTSLSAIECNKGASLARHAICEVGGAHCLRNAAHRTRVACDCACGGCVRARGARRAGCSLSQWRRSAWLAWGAETFSGELGSARGACVGVSCAAGRRANGRRWVWLEQAAQEGP